MWLCTHASLMLATVCPIDRRFMGPLNLSPAALSTHYCRKVPSYTGPRGFLEFLLGKFCDANLFFYFFIGTKCQELRKESLWSRPLGAFLIALQVIWLDGLNIFGDVVGQKKMTSLTAVRCWASMKVRFSTILTRGFLFSQLSASISASNHKFPNKKRKPLGPG